MYLSQLLYSIHLHSRVIIPFFFFSISGVIIVQHFARPNNVPCNALQAWELKPSIECYKTSRKTLDTSCLHIYTNASWVGIELTEWRVSYCIILIQFISIICIGFSLCQKPFMLLNFMC